MKGNKTQTVGEENIVLFKDREQRENKGRGKIKGRESGWREKKGENEREGKGCWGRQLWREGEGKQGGETEGGKEGYI